jgi:hypothetical protein
VRRVQNILHRFATIVKPFAGRAGKEERRDSGARLVVGLYALPNNLRPSIPIFS